MDIDFNRVMWSGHVLRLTEVYRILYLQMQVQEDMIKSVEHDDVSRTSVRITFSRGILEILEILQGTVIL
jgi:hypothetical protein